MSFMAARQVAGWARGLSRGLKISGIRIDLDIYPTFVALPSCLFEKI